jgi:hypothetical protein
VDIQTPELKKLHDYWSEKAGDRQMPSRGDLDPIIEIPELTPNIWLVDVEHDPLTFRFRLLGNEVVNRYGADFTGKRLDEVDFGDRTEEIRREYEQTATGNKPVYARHQIHVVQAETYLPYERILLPLSDDGETVNMILGGGYPLEREEE